MPSDYILVSALIFLLCTHAKSSLKSDENLQPDWDRLFSDYKIWVAACTQVGDIFWVVNASRGAQIRLDLNPTKLVLLNFELHL